jgi:hypothetical protein
MEDRGFNEVELRTMLEHADGYRADILEGRFVIDTRHSKASWEVIVEPDSHGRLIVVITAYPIG